MSDWKESSIGELFDVQLGKMLSVKSRYGDQYPYLANRNVRWGGISIGDDLGMMHFTTAERDRYRLEPGDLLVCEGGEVGRAALWSGELSECYFQNAIHRLRAKARVDTRFMRHYFEFAAVHGYLRALTGQTSIGHLPRANLVSWVVPYPPLEEQQRIADVLDTVDDTIRSTERVITKCKMIRAGVAADLLDTADGGSPTDIPAAIGHNCRRSLSSNASSNQHCLGDIGTVVGGGTPARDRPAYWDDSIPWLTPTELRDGSRKYVLETQESISPLGLAESGARLVPRGALLITSRASIGHCALAGVPLATNQGFKVLIPNDNVDCSYLYHFGLTLGRKMNRLASGTTFSEVSSRDFERIAIRLPPLEEQRRIAQVLDTVDNAIRAEQIKLAKLRQLRAGLAEDLLSGRVRTVAA